MLDGFFVGEEIFAKQTATAPRRTALLADAPEPRAGYGSCQVGDCPCKQFTSAGWICATWKCGHKFEDHV
jgi:hypothetical protein